MKTKTSLTRNSLNGSVSRLMFLLIPLLLACFPLSPQARAVCQEGCDTFTNNTFLGDDALINDIPPGVDNTAIGAFALSANTTGGDNTANGSGALFSNTIGIANTGVGKGALGGNTTGISNTATGAFSLSSNTIGIRNTANGGEALDSNTTGNFNTVIGNRALNRNTTGSDNIALGYKAGIHLTTGDSNIDIGNVGVAGESNTIRIGTTGTQTNAYVAGISGATIPTGVPVIIDTTGHLGTTTSSARFKEEIKPMDKTSEAILSLKPVTFRYKHELDPEGIAQFGLVAEDVEKVNPDLVARDEQGKPYTVRYEAVNAMLLNEFLKEHETIQELKKQVAELTAGLQKVSAQLQLSKSAPQTVVKNQ